MFLFGHHAKSHQGSSVASVRIWGVCLPDLLHSLYIDCIERFWWDGVCYLIWFSVPLFFFFHFNVVFWLYGNRVINWQSEPLNRLLCDCATGMICPNFQSSIDFKWDTGSEENHTRILMLIITAVMP